MNRSLLFLFTILTTCLLSAQKNTSPYIMVLGVAQDAGYPQMGCEKKCCKKIWKNPKLQKYTSCLAIIDPVSKQQWIIDATPDIKHQINLLENMSGLKSLNGVFLTHAHIGHYTGLMHFGREVMGTESLSVYCMPRMKRFLENNGPWSQLISLDNIYISELNDNVILTLNDRVQIKPFLVPHRDEFSETVGYKITINKRSLIFIPDIDKWNAWGVDIAELIKTVDYAFLDGTFYATGELGRDMSTIPHPFVKESMKLFSSLSKNDKQKVHFIHFNHTNPLFIINSEAQYEVKNNGFNIAKQGLIIVM